MGSGGVRRPWRTRARRASGGLGLCLLLLTAACARQPQEAATSALQDALASHQASLAGLGAPATVLPGSAPVEGTAIVATAAAAPGGAAPMLAGNLVGLTAELVRERLGEPRLRRAEGPAEVWHYQASHCHLDLVLYPDDGSRPLLRVAFAAARAAGTMRRGEAACLTDIARGATRPASPVLTVQAAAGA